MSITVNSDGYWATYLVIAYPDIPIVMPEANADMPVERPAEKWLYAIFNGIP